MNGSDYTLCKTENCAIKMICFRSRATPDPLYQSYADFGQQCKDNFFNNYIPVSDEDRPHLNPFPKDEVVRGCPYCDASNPEYGKLEYYVDHKVLNVYLYYGGSTLFDYTDLDFKINYCPHCGKEQK